jgi:DNA-directed RNA polymerase subunit M/transcription elongation factor TFIIS
MIRFPCPECGKKLKATEEDRGSSVRCPECRTKAKVPAADDDAAGADEGAPKSKRRRARGATKTLPPLPAPPSLGQRIGRFWGDMPITSKLLLGGTLFTAIGSFALGLVLSLAVVPEEDTTLYVVEKVCTVLKFAGTIAFLGMLYGALSGCPQCHAWFAREEKEKTLAEPQVFYVTATGERLAPFCEEDDEDGLLEGTRYIRSVAQTHFTCKRCRHRWTSDVVEEYQKDRPLGRKK